MVTPRAGRRWRIPGTAPLGGVGEWLLLPGLLVLLALPLLVALAVLRSPRWYPVLDLAWTELRVRDVGTSDSPLIGLAGRIGVPGEEGSHPGPISFWALAPVYRLLGATPWAMQVASGGIHLLAMAVALWTARRRGGRTLVLAVALVLAVLAGAYGASTLTEAWNPYLPVLWWVTFLLAAWSVLEGDLPLLPVAVVAGTFCAQTHVPYLGLVAGVLAVVAAVLAGRAVVGRRRRTASGAADGTRSTGTARWVLLAGALAAVLWAPAVVDELQHSPGNLSKLWQYFAEPPEAQIGLADGVSLLLVHLNPWRLVASGPVTARWPTDASIVPGAALMAVWLASALWALRTARRRLVSLHLVLAVALFLGAVSLSRIFGFVWYYLSLWAGGLGALLLLAVASTVASTVSPRLPVRKRIRAETGLRVTLLGAVVVAVAVFAVDARDVSLPDARLSETLRRLSPPTEAALEAGVGGSAGRDGRYLVTWSDPVNIGASGFGLLLELERRGFDVAATVPNKAGATTHRVREPEEAETEIHLAVGPDIATWRDRPGAREVVIVDSRDDRQREEYRRIRDVVVADLERAGLQELATSVDDNVFVTANNDRTPAAIRRRMQRLIDLGLPTAVFVAPISADGA